MERTLNKINRVIQALIDLEDEENLGEIIDDLIEIKTEVDLKEHVIIFRERRVEELRRANEQKEIENNKLYEKYVDILVKLREKENEEINEE